MAGNPRSAKRRGAGRPSKADTSNRPEKILAAAVKLYACHGFEKISTKNIAEEAGVAASLVSHHFGNKAKLRATCNRYVMDEIHAALDKVIEALEQDVIYGDFLNLITGISTDRVYILRYLALLFSQDDEDANDLFREYFNKFHQITLHLMSKGALRDDIDPVWATMTRVYAQLGTVFLYRQVEAITGGDPYGPDAAKTRLDTVSKIFRSGAFRTVGPDPTKD